MPDPVHSQQRLGKYMIIAAWVILLALLTALFEGWLVRQEHPNEALARTSGSGPAVVKLKRNRQGHYLAPGFINGQKVRFLVDTGATDVNIPAAVAARLRLKRGYPTYAHTANGTITVYQTRLSSVRLGNIVLRDVRASINSHMQGSTVLLGMSFMQQLELNQRDGILTLRQN